MWILLILYITGVIIHVHVHVRMWILLILYITAVIIHVHVHVNLYIHVHDYMCTLSISDACGLIIPYRLFLVIRNSNYCST